MTCRHGAGDPRCSTTRNYERERETLIRDLTQQIKAKEAETPDSTKFQIEDFVEVGRNLVLKVSYPNCKKCSYEGIKVLVYRNMNIRTAIRWRKIDPHFRDDEPSNPNEAPGPAARFPASVAGWDDALNFAKGETSV